MIHKHCHRVDEMSVVGAVFYTKICMHVIASLDSDRLQWFDCGCILRWLLDFIVQASAASFTEFCSLTVSTLLLFQKTPLIEDDY